MVGAASSRSHVDVECAWRIFLFDRGNACTSCGRRHSCTDLGLCPDVPRKTGARNLRGRASVLVFRCLAMASDLFARVPMRDCKQMKTTIVRLILRGCVLIAVM